MPDYSVYRGEQMVRHGHRRPQRYDILRREMDYSLGTGFPRQKPLDYDAIVLAHMARGAPTSGFYRPVRLQLVKRLQKWLAHLDNPGAHFDGWD